jgi:hypothetical protein
VQNLFRKLQASKNVKAEPCKAVTTVSGDIMNSELDSTRIDHGDAKEDRIVACQP